MDKLQNDMTTEQKLEGHANQEEPEVAPPPIEDEQQPESRAARQEPDEPRQPEAKREAEPKPKRRDKRDDIVRMYRELRSKEQSQPTQESPPPAPQAVDTRESPQPETAAESLVSQRQDPTNSGQQNINKSPQDIEVTLKIFGREERKPLSEVIRLAQIAAASENRLNEAKELYSEVKSLRDQLQQLANQSAQQPHQSQQATPADAAQPQASTQSQAQPGQAQTPENPPAGVEIDRDRIRQVAEKLQYGDPEEGTQALAEYTAEVIAKARASQPSIDPAQIATWVQDAVSQIQYKAEADAALQRFAEQYKPLVTNEDLKLTTITVLTRELMNDLRKAGFREEDLQANRANTAQLAYWHRAIRNTHRDLRSYDQLLNDVGDYMVKTFNLKVDQPQPTPNGAQPSATGQQQRDPAQALQDRLERKRVLPQQPTPANIRAPIDAGPRPKTRQDILNEMRLRRGYTPRTI